VAVPKLWSDTIEAHRREVRESVIDTTAALVAEHGLRAVTMSQIAAGAGIGRATLYKYFPDVETILVVWHERQIDAHLERLVELRERSGEPRQRLAAVLEAYALMSYEVVHQHHGTDLAVLVHQPHHLARARQHLFQLIRDLIAEAVAADAVRNDVAPDELASYCLAALSAATAARSSQAAVRRLVTLTLDGLSAPVSLEV
jgi:AcrR family transcriptional regulator